MDTCLVRSGAGIQADISSTNGGLLKLYVHLCLIRNNAARYNAGGGYGGGLYATGYVEVSNTTFESNSSRYHGGGIMFTYRPPYTDATISPKVDNCIFLNNYNVDCCSQWFGHCQLLCILRLPTAALRDRQGPVAQYTAFRVLT